MVRRVNITSTRLAQRITPVDYSHFSPFIHLSLSLGNISSLEGMPLELLHMPNVRDIEIEGATEIEGASPRQHSLDKALTRRITLLAGRPRFLIPTIYSIPPSC